MIQRKLKVFTLKRKTRLKVIIKNLAGLIHKLKKLLILKLKAQTEEIQPLNSFKLYHKKDLNQEEMEEEILDLEPCKKSSIEVTAGEIDFAFLGKRKVNLRLMKQKMISSNKFPCLILFLSQLRRK